MKIKVRDARVEDAPSIARVHIESWRTSYRGIVPDTVLDNLSVAQREEYWRERFFGEQSGFVSVAVAESGEIAGFASGGPERDGIEGFEGELYAIYLLEACKRQGAGTRLVRAIQEGLQQSGMRSMLVWVLAENAPARRFYEKRGGLLLPHEKRLAIGGRDLVEVSYGWQTI